MVNGKSVEIAIFMGRGGSSIFVVKEIDFYAQKRAIFRFKISRISCRNIVIFRCRTRVISPKN